MAATAGGETSCTPAAIENTEAEQRCLMAWIKRHTDSLCDHAASTRSAGDYDKARLLVDLLGWRSYLLETSQELARRSPSTATGETLLELTDHLNCLRLLEETIVLGSGGRTLADFTMDEILKLIPGKLEQQVAQNDDIEEEEPDSGVIEEPFQLPAAGSDRLTPFNVETFDLKDAVLAMSDVRMPKLKMQAETYDEVFFLFEAPGDEPPPSPKIRANVLSARTKGHDADTGGRVDCQFFSPPVDLDDLEEESALQPGRHTDALVPCLKYSVNVVSIKVASSGAAGFPLSLYGSVVVRDDLDKEGMCLFRRDRDHPQLITSHDESLLLTGPTRGLLAYDCMEFDFDLKLKTMRVEDDMDLSQETILHNCIFSESPFISDKIESPHGTIEFNYAPVGRALESTIEIQILKNHSATQNEDEKMADPFVDRLYGRISARNTRHSEEIVLFDSDASGVAITVADDGTVELSRRVVAVPVLDSLVVTVETWDGGADDDMRGASMKSSFTFTPLFCGEARAVVPCARRTMQIRVFWSALCLPFIDF